MFQRFWALARNTFLETVRQPIYGVILLVTAGMMVMNVSLAAYTLEDDNKLLLSLGLSTLLLSSLFLTAFSAAGILSREIENKTVLTVISKPVGRPMFFLAKYAGLMAALGVAFYLSSLAFILAQRHGVLQNTADPWDAPVLVFGFGGAILAILLAAFLNYFWNMQFATTVVGLAAGLLTVGTLLVGKFDKEWGVIPFGSDYVDFQILTAVFLVFLIAMILAAVALAASTRFGQLMTLVICTVFLSVGIASDYAFGQYAEKGVFIAKVAYGTLPNLGPFWVIDGLTSGSEETYVPFGYVLRMTLYTILVTAGVLGIGVFAFQKREVG